MTEPTPTYPATADLIMVATSDDGWTTLYQHRTTGIFWELSYPQSEMHGGGSQQLRELAIDTAEQWLA